MPPRRAVRQRDGVGVKNMVKSAERQPSSEAGYLMDLLRLDQPAGVQASRRRADGRMGDARRFRWCRGGVEQLAKCRERRWDNIEIGNTKGNRCPRELTRLQGCAEAERDLEAGARTAAETRSEDGKAPGKCTQDGAMLGR